MNIRSSCAYLFAAILISCGSANKPASDDKAENATIPAGVTTGEKQLNINVLWDLSDRIDNKVNPASPPHSERDIEIIRYLTEVFRADMQKRGAYKAKSKIRVFFSPAPSNPRINDIAKNLSYDLSALGGSEANKGKKQVYDSISPVFTRNAGEIYNLVMSTSTLGSWDGSDIWRFFKNNVKDYCVEKSPTYRNILVILTDGYIYHKDSKVKQGNRTAYVLPETLKPLRNDRNWKETFASKDYGLITTRNDLQDLEILVLEITPNTGNRNDEDILKEYLMKWFTEMGVKKENMACYNTDLPEYTKKKIAEFLNK